jgi:hypothetical protein
MRDPDLVLRAQRAATALERAWDRYRTSHGLGADPLPAISSYVGYSLGEPWGEPRVVFGVAADEAERLAVLLEDWAGPEAAGPSLAGIEPAMTPEAASTGTGHGEAAGHVQVPAQPRPVSSKRARPKDQARSDRPGGSREQARPADRPAAARNLSPLDSGRSAPPGGGMESGSAGKPGRPRDSGGALDPSRPLDSLGLPLDPGRSLYAAPASHPPASHPAPAHEESDTDLMAFRPRLEPASYLDEGPEPDPFFAGSDERPAGRTRIGRVAGSHAMPRQKRPGAPAQATGSGQRAGRPQEGAGRRGLTSLAAELAGWASGELPGQAAHRFAPHPPGSQYGQASDQANWPAGGLPADGGI